MKSITGTPSFMQNVKQLKENHIKDGIPQGQSATAQGANNVKLTELTPEMVKKQFNNSILQSNMQVSVGAGNDSLALLYKTAIEGINDVLKAEFGDNAVQASADSGLDISPQATADRIVSMSTAFFTQYHEQHADMSVEEAAKSFAEIIGGGIDQGFSEAREVLDGLKVLEGDISSNIDTTFDLVQEGLKAFVDSYRETKKEEQD